MRVAHVIDSLEQGGAERSLVELLPALAARGVAVQVVVRKPGGALTGAARSAGAEVVELGTTSRRGTRAALQAHLATTRPDVVHTTLFETNLAGRVAGARLGLAVVSTLAGTPYGPEHRDEPAIRTVRLRAAQAADAASCRLVWRFHAPAEHVAEVMARRLRIERSRIEVIPRARDAERFGARAPERRARVRHALGVPGDAPVVLALARHEHAKGLDVLAAAVDRLRPSHPDLVVLVAGREGAATPQLRAGGLRLLGHRDDVGDLLAATDLLVLPSRREGLPGTLVEALALATPVVASDLPGVREVLGDLGVRVPVGDAGALAEAVDAVLGDPSRAGDPAAAMTRARDRFSPEAVAAATIALWERAVDAGPPAPLGRLAGRWPPR